MAKLTKIAVLMVFLLLIGVVSTFAQDDSDEICDLNTSDVITIVEEVCTGVGRDQVCYGNYEVNAIPFDTEAELGFDNPGDTTNLAEVRSLYLSALDPDQDVWGIAQMRLSASTSRGLQDVTLLLFGDVSVDSASNGTIVLDAVVGRYSANVRNTPSANAVVLQSLPSGTVISTVGRLNDSSWVRIRLESGVIGWVSSQLITMVGDHTFEELPVQESATPYFGPMQAFYYNSGSGGSCSNVLTDGLLIQTPEGVARVTLLINEVSIELIAGQNGATALVQANQEDGMTVSMVDGSAYVEANGTSFFVDSTQQTTIELGDDLGATGTPTEPTTYDVEVMQDAPLLAIVRDPSIPILPTVSATGTPPPSETTGNNGGGRGNGHGNGNNAGGNGQGNGQGNGHGNGNAGGNGNGNANGRGGN